jgi:radical SAM protein with 4Fe4S-binding SPASM domain
MTTAASLEHIDAFVAATRSAVFVRRADRLLLIRPEKTLGINESGAAILEGLYGRDGRSSAEVLGELAPRLGAGLDRLVADSHQLLETISRLMQGDFSPRPNVRYAPYNRGLVKYPILAEIALTYECQNRCLFCYAASPHRAAERRPMSTDQVQRVMERIYHEAHVPSLSFTGGESSLRRDLPELVRCGERLGFRVNLITNGVRAADASWAGRLVEAGLASAQVSLEAADAALHDRIVGRAGAFAKTVAGIRNLRALGIHVHTNTTLCALNLDHAPKLASFVAGELGLPTMSMNMVIRTGMADGGAPIGVRYGEVAERLPRLIEVAKQAGVRFVWYSPIPYCLFNPVLHGLGGKACACVDGLLSVDPEGQLLPCSSFETGLGSLLDQTFAEIGASAAARYWREKRFSPPVCRDCPDVDVCGGACPLYWDAAGSFSELPRRGSDDACARRAWELGRHEGSSFGVALPAREESEVWVR